MARHETEDIILDVSLSSSYGTEYVQTEIDDGATAFGLTADEARAYAADLVVHADALDERNAGGGARG